MIVLGAVVWVAVVRQRLLARSEQELGLQADP
jgi:hypothetical protein